MRAILKREPLASDQLEIALVDKRSRRQGVTARLMLEQPVRSRSQLSVNEREQGIECLSIPAPTSLQQLCCVGVASQDFWYLLPRCSGFQAAVQELHHGNGRAVAKVQVLRKPHNSVF